MKLTRRLRRAGLRVAALAIGCQFLVPAGYMPGSFANGTPFVLCTMYTAARGHHDATDSMGAMHADMPDHSAAQHEEHTGAEAWEHCPLGALSAGAALAFDLQPAILPGEPDRIPMLFVVRTGSTTLLTARARAPPQPALIQFA
jgi:hypothetical protein